MSLVVSVLPRTNNTNIQPYRKIEFLPQTIEFRILYQYLVTYSTLTYGRLQLIQHYLAASVLYKKESLNIYYVAVVTNFSYKGRHFFLDQKLMAPQYILKIICKNCHYRSRDTQVTILEYVLPFKFKI